MDDPKLTLVLPRSDVIAMCKAFGADRQPKRKVRMGLLNTLLGATDGAVVMEDFVAKKARKKQDLDAAPETNADISANINNMGNSEQMGMSMQAPFRQLPSFSLPSSNIIIVGCGEVSRLYANCIATNASDMFITAVCDVNLASATTLAQEIDSIQRERAYGSTAPSCVITTSLDDLFAKVPGKNRCIAINLTPPQYHYETNRRLLSEGRCHVWSEKPLASTFEEATLLVDLAAKLHLQLGASPISIYGAAQQLVSRQLVVKQQPLLGTIRTATASVLCGGWCDPKFRLDASGWKSHRRFGIGSLRDVGVYPIHILSAWLGPVKAVSAFSSEDAYLAKHEKDDDSHPDNSNLSPPNSQQDTKVVDCWTITLRFCRGQVGTVLTSLSLSAKGTDEAYSLTLRGDRGSITLDSMWNGDTKMRFVPDGGEDRQGIAQELFPWRTPFIVSHGVSHPHVCDWGAGVELLAKSLEMSSEKEFGKVEASNLASFSGQHARHLVEVLESAEVSASNGGRLEAVTSTFPWPPKALSSHNMGPVRTLGKWSGGTLTSSPVGFGTMKLAQMKDPMSILDSAWNMGCNTFDLGHVYGSQVECLFGKWMASRIALGSNDAGPGRLLRRVESKDFTGTFTRMLSRQDLILIGKGGHPFRNSQYKARLSASELNKDLNESLTRLGTDYIDVFLLHRDDPERFPNVGAVAETMHDLVRSKRIRSWGVSNWSLDRIISLIDYAHTNDLVPPTVTSPQHSLALPHAPVWDGIGIHTSIMGQGTRYRDMLLNSFKGNLGTQSLSAVTWAPLAEGFLAGAELTRRESKAAWQQRKNMARRERMRRVAGRHGITDAAVAIAYCLHTGSRIVIVGSSSIPHLQDAVRGSRVRLTAEEIFYMEAD